MKAIVIGSGMSGLTAAAALASAGHQVSVFEQYPAPGGVTASFIKDGYRWDLGQLLIEGLGKNEPTGGVLSKLGVLDKIRTVVDDRGYVFPDFEIRKPAEYGGFRWRVPHPTPIQGLWFVGAQSESGGGVGAVVPAAYKTAQKIMQTSG